MHFLSIATKFCKFQVYLNNKLAYLRNILYIYCLFNLRYSSHIFQRIRQESISLFELARERRKLKERPMTRSVPFEIIVCPLSRHAEYHSGQIYQEGKFALRQENTASLLARNSTLNKALQARLGTCCTREPNFWHTQRDVCQKVGPQAQQLPFTRQEKPARVVEAHL